MRTRLLFPLYVLFAVALAGLASAEKVPEHRVNVVRVVSPGGIEAWLVSDHLNPIINLRFAFDGGAAQDPEGKSGLANMVSSLLDEGAGPLDSQAFQRRLEDLSITLRFDAGLDSFHGRLTTLSENWEQAFDLLKLALTKPRFDDAPFQRIRSQILAGLRQDQEDPDTVAGKVLDRELFGDHPYGRPVDGTIDSVSAIVTEDLRRFARERLARDNLNIGVVGDIKPEELARRLDEIFAGLPSKSVPSDVTEAAPDFKGGVKVVTMDVPQSALAFAQKGLKRDDPDFYTAYVLNHMMGGGGFTSRLYDEIREKRGLAYSVGSYLNPLDHVGLLQGYGGTANARVGETIDVLKNEWRKMAEQGVEQKELDDAKTYLIGSFPLRLTSTSGIAGTLVAMQQEKLGLDYLNRRNSFIDAVTLDDVNRLAKKLLTPDNLVIVVVGAPEGVKSTR